jgi:hypothetical protein
MRLYAFIDMLREKWDVRGERWESEIVKWKI